jgi:hypothetical protein
MNHHRSGKNIRIEKLEGLRIRMANSITSRLFENANRHLK